MQAPTIQEEGGGYTFEWGAGCAIEVSKVKRSRFGDDADVRVLDKSQEGSPVLASATVRLGDLRERQRFCQAIESRDGHVADWDDRLMLVADYISQRTSAPFAATPVTVKLIDVEREEVEWLSRNRLARGKIHMLDGDPGVGKSYLTCALIAAITTGAPLFGEGGTRREPGRALLLSGEDGAGDTIRPRIEDMGGNLELVTLLTGVLSESGEERHLSLATDLAAVEQVFSQGDYALWIIDPINAYIGGDVDTNNDASLRTVLSPIAALTDKYGVATVPVRHLTKSARDRAMYRGLGGIGYTAAARLAAIVGKNPENEEERVIAWVKNNLGPQATSVAFSVEDGRFGWLGETDVPASALVAPEKGTEARSALDQGEEFLREVLADGEMSANEVEDQARKAGVTNATLKRAKARLGVIARAVRVPGVRGVKEWMMSLPGGLEAQEAHSRKDEPLNLVSYLNQPLAPELVEPLNNSPSEDQEEPADHGDDDAERDLCFGSAKALAFPQLPFRPGQTVPAGEEHWDRFTLKNDMGAVRTAQAALDKLTEGREA